MLWLVMGVEDTTIWGCWRWVGWFWGGKGSYGSILWVLVWRNKAIEAKGCGLNFATIGEAKYSVLKKLIEKWDTIQVVKDFQGDKAPSLDGFTMDFFQQFWRVVESDVLVVFEEFHKYSKFVKTLNASFIALILNKLNANNIRDFRPIRLIGNVYKFFFFDKVYKILAWGVGQ